MKEKGLIYQRRPRDIATYRSALGEARAVGRDHNYLSYPREPSDVDSRSAKEESHLPNSPGDICVIDCTGKDIRVS